jgi:hypothetical protein
MTRTFDTSTPTFWLRAASIVALLFAAGHTLGAPWTPATSGAAAGVVDAMKTLHFAAMGRDATYWRVYYGFGVSITCYLVALAIMTWQIAALARSGARRLRPLILTLAGLYAAIGVLAWMYFFAAPLVMAAIVVACLLAAFVCARERAASGSAAGRERVLQARYSAR